MSSRGTALRNLLAELRAVRPGQRALIALDGVDGAGKTMLAHELVSLAKTAAEVPGHVSGRRVTAISIDGFHHSRAIRYAHGTGPDTFYRRSYDYGAFVDSVVEPFRRGDSVVPAVWDVDKDRPIDPEPLSLPNDCVLLIEGIFLHRPELVDRWDASVWVDVPFEVSVPRGNERFAGAFDADAEATSNHRYVRGQRLYFSEASPREKATWVFDNRDLDRPNLIRSY